MKPVEIALSMSLLSVALGSHAAQIDEPGGPLGIAWGFTYGIGDSKAEVFMPKVRELGGQFSKVYLFWNQIEPQKGHYDFSALDAYLNQLAAPEEGLVSIFSASTWATERSAELLPPSPARKQEDYYRFVHDTVARARGKVRYWQNDCEPNNPIYWAGTPEQFVVQLKTFYRAVKDADPKAIVVAGGYDGLFNPPGTWAYPTQEKGLEFFDLVMREAGQSFDVFDVRLYGDPYTIPYRVNHMREMLKERNCNQPIICTEYNGPGFFEIPPNTDYVPLIARWSASVATNGANAGRTGSEDIAALYAKMPALAPQTQMFMAGCSRELDDKLARMQARDLVMRNVLALSVGVQKTLFWDLWHDTSDRDNMMTLMYGKLKLMEYDHGAFTKELPNARAFQRLAAALRGVESVERVETPDHPSIFLFDIKRCGRPQLFVVWEKASAFSGEDHPPSDFAWPSLARAVKATDILGQPVPASVVQGRIHAPVSITPAFVEVSP